MAGIQFSPDPSHRVGCAGTWALQRCTPSAAKFGESVGLGARLGRSLGRSGLLRLRGVLVTSPHTQCLSCRVCGFSSSPHSLTPETTGLLFVAHKLNRRNCLRPDHMHNSWLSLPVSVLSAFDSPVREIIVVSVLEQWCPIIGKWVSKLVSINLMKYYIGPE